MAGGFAFGTSGASGTGFAFSAPARKASSGELTARQWIELQTLMNAEKHRSLLGTIAHGTGSALGWTFDKLLRPSYAVAAATKQGLAGEGFDPGDALHGLKQGFLGRDKATFSEVIKQEFPHFARSHKVLAAASGLTLDILTDPTLPLVLASNAIPGLGGVADAATIARYTAKAAALGKAATAEEKYSAARDAYKILKDAGPTFSARKSEAGLQAIVAKAEMRGMPARYDSIRLSLAQRAAQHEAETNSTRVLQATYKIPFKHGTGIKLTPTSIGGKRVAPLAPSLKRTAEGAGLLGRVPAAAKTANTLGMLFKHGFREEEFAKPQLLAQHAKELLTDEYIAHSNARINRFHSMSEDDRFKALAWGEETPGLVQGKGRRLNEAMVEDAVKKGTLTQDQGDFVKAWHDHMQFLRARDSEFGVEYSKELGDKLYVPHMYTRDGGIALKSAVARAAGYTRNREVDLSLRELKGMSQDTAKQLNLETETMNLLAHRTRKAASEHARHVLLDHMRASGGVVSKVPALDRRRRTLDRAAAIRAKADAIPLLTPNDARVGKSIIGRKVQVRHDKKLRGIMARYTPHAEALDKELATTAERILAREGKPVTPTWSRLQKHGSEAFEKNIKHFSKEDQALARELRAIFMEHRRLKRKLDNLPRKRGGPAKAERAIADDLAYLKKRLEDLRPLSVADIEKLQRDPLSKWKIGYQLQPQGRMGVVQPEAHRPTGLQFAPGKRRGDTWRGNLETQLEVMPEEIKAHYAPLVKKYANEGRINHTQEIKRVQAKADKLYDQVATAIERQNERSRKLHGRLTEEFQTRQFKNAEKFNRMDAQATKLEDRATRQFMRNPDIPEGYVELAKKIHGERYHFAPEVHRAMTRVEKIMLDDERMGNLGGTARKLLSTWKLGVTTINPGYRVRNTLSDIWNMYIAGVPTPRIAQYGQKAARLQRRAYTASEKLAKGEQLSRTESNALYSLAEMYNHGVLSGLFQGDIQVVSKIMQRGGKARDYFRENPLAVHRWATKAMQDWNRHAENWGRVTHYLYRRDYEKLGATASADWVKKAHFDYEELTPFERDKLKLFFPFYTWTRKNIPFQLMSIASRPGKVSTFAKTIRTSNELASGEPYGEDKQESLLPEWMRDKYAFRIPGGGDSSAYMLPQIGIADLARLSHPLSGALELSNPAIKVGYELGTGRSSLTGQKISGENHPRNPISGAAAAVLSHVPGADVGTTSRNVRGQKVYGAGANPWVSYIAGQMPWTNFLVNQTASIKREQRGEGPGRTIAGQLGVSTYTRDYEAELTAAQLEFAAKMKRIMRGFRDVGAYPEASTYGAAPTGFQGQIAAMLRGG